MSHRFDDKEAKAFFEAVMAVENIDECCAFFEDLCTIKELQSMIQRYHVACMLNEGRLYSEIVKETGASTATISRVNRSLTYGNDGYKVILERCRKKDE